MIGFTNWQLRTAIASLLEKGILLREHLFKEHHGNNFAPKNRTYYYSLNYEGLEEFAKKHQTAESTENVRFVNSTDQFCENSAKQFCDSPQNITENTSIENISKDRSHPTLPCESEKKEKKNNQEDALANPLGQDFSNLELLKLQETDFVNPKVIEQDTNIGQVEENIKQNVCTDNQDVSESVQVEVEKPITKPRLKTSKGTKPNRKGRNEAPWKDEGQFKRFYRALIQALPIVANSHSPQGLAQTIIRQLRSGIPHSYWDDFVAGLPIGTSTMPVWEVEPGVPYPMFVEYLTEKIKAGDNKTSDEQTRNEVFRILSKPRQAKAFWGQFKRSLVNVSEQMMRDRALGVSNPNTPVWTRERIEPSLSEAAAAGQKIMAINGNPQAVIESGQIPQLESKDIPSVPQSPPDLWSDESQPKSSPKVNLQELLVKKLGETFGSRCRDRASRFIKQMPKVSPEEAEAEAKAESEAKQRQQMNRKTHISQMSVAEINELLTDPITRKELMPQLWQSDYELITNEYGDIIGIRRSSSS